MLFTIFSNTWKQTFIGLTDKKEAALDIKKDKVEARFSAPNTQTSLIKSNLYLAEKIVHSWQSFSKDPSKGQSKDQLSLPHIEPRGS